MRLVILSDTHGNYPLAIKALDEAGEVDRIIHLGDVMEDALMIEAIIGTSLIKLPGNCDPGVEAPRSLSATFDGTRVFMTHGDRYQVKSGLARLHDAAAREQARLVLYGHTHVATATEMDGILFVNPGSLSYKCLVPSYAVVTIDAGCVSVEIKAVNGER